MKKLILALLCLQTMYATQSLAKGPKAANAQPGGKGYHITLKMHDAPDSMVYLVHYYGKQGPVVFISDSALLNRGTANFNNTGEDFTGGIYMIMLWDKKTSFELLLNKGDNIIVSASKMQLPLGVQFSNSPENIRFLEYKKYVSVFADQQEQFKKQLAAATTAADTAEIRKNSQAVVKQLTKYKSDYAAKYPGTLLAQIFNAMEVPVVPEGVHLLPDGHTKDTAYAYHYYKDHYWEHFDMRDDRLILTPLYDNKLDEYFTKMVVPVPDSVEKEGDLLLKNTKGTKDMFHYTLWWLTRYAENSKIMGMDEVFVHLVENYYEKGDATWLKNDELAKYIERGSKISPNIIGNIAPEIKLPEVFTQKDISLHEIKAPYTVIVFYSPNCGHCQHELPLIDSLYESVLKAKGVKIYTVATEGDEKSISEFLMKLKNARSWTNTWDKDHTSDYHNKYDVYSTPTLYLLDEKKIIRGKRLDHSNVAGLVDMLEKKKKE